MPIPQPIRVFVIDDHPIIAEGVEMALNNSKNYQYIGFSKSIRNAIDPIRNGKIDVVVLDLELSKGQASAIQPVVDLQHFFPTLPLVIFSTHINREIKALLLQHNIKVYLHKSFERHEMQHALFAAHKGLNFWKIHQSALSNLSINSTFDNRFDLISLLTKRESEVLQQLLWGKNNQEVSEQLNIEYPTVRKHRQNIMEKLQVSNAQQLHALFRP